MSLTPENFANSNGDALYGSAERLASRIQDRVQHRLGDRLRDLCVRVKDNRVVLEGRCTTYYSKQLAQHAALGAIEDEQLVNAICVGAFD